MDHNYEGYSGAFMLSQAFKFMTAKAAGLIAAPMGLFLATDYLTGHPEYGVLLAAMCSCITAIFVTRPKLIAARAAALVAQTNSADLHTTQVFSRLTEIHKSQIDFLKERISRYEKSEILIRATKHKLINAYTAANLRIILLEDIIRYNNIPMEDKYIPESFKEITGEEDQKMIHSMFVDQP